jgi:hypothetical protein
VASHGKQNGGEEELRNLAAVELLLATVLLAAGSHPPPVLLPNQGYPKVCHDPLDLPSTFILAAGD